MDRIVYTPGAGHLPPVLAGHDGVLHAMTVRLNDVAKVGRTRSEDVVFTGVRGVGKTALLTAYSHAAARQGFEVISHQAVAGQAGLVGSVMARTALRIDQGAAAWSRARRALERVSGVTFGVAGVCAEISLHDRADPPAGGRVHPEALAFALAALADEVRRDTPAGDVLLTVDELQVAAATDLPLLAATLHRLNVDHPTAAVAFAGTGLPHLPRSSATPASPTPTDCCSSKNCHRSSPPPKRCTPSSNPRAKPASAGNPTPQPNWYS